ncbi:hypothetical protein ACHAXA_002436 [Cyclostephanos tholiformis]|uniref:Conserved oligomeric Golgi complex subunit 7 n=1 Tax=Cyclostephanos tholiformis TaxID=382380 RepID=A0ABD3R9N4_9STRA
MTDVALSSSSSADPTLDPELENRLSALLASPDDDFSVSRYLNLALDFRGRRRDGEYGDMDDDDDADDEHRQHWLEQRMTSLALQLQMQTQSCHDEIGRIGAELRAVVPRCAADVGRVRVGLEGIEDDVRGLLEGMDAEVRRRRKRRDDAVGGGAGDSLVTTTTTSGPDVGAGVGAGEDNEVDEEHMATSMGGDGDNDMDDPLTTLQTLLSLRNHLRSARSILSAASSWDETINSIPMLLSTTPPNLVEAVSALSQLEQGARALAGMPEGRDEREDALSRLRTQLEVLLKPQLLHALKRMDTRLGPLVQCVGMYGSLGKMGVMREEYVKIRPVEIHALWFSFGGGKNVDGGGNRGSDGDDPATKATGRAAERKPGGAEDDDEVEDFDFEDEDNSASASSRPPLPQITTSAATANAGQFVEFLPKFFEATLELLTKERTQSRTVFGPDLAPSIVVRVLIECFRPIVTSFERRLAVLCPPPGGGGRRGIDVTGGRDTGGMEAIATAYESTVRFLSLAYDRMEAWNVGSTTTAKVQGGNGQNAKTKEGNDPAAPAAIEDNETLRCAIRSAFLLIASPFLPFQRALSEAEQRPLGEAASIVARDVRGVTSFEDAAERLGDLAPFMFPLVEAAINRFELLNSGYNAPATLSAIDKLLSNHAAELAIAMGTLSTNAASSSGTDFDEMHVNCALKILCIAGMFKRNLRSFEHSVRDRFRALSILMVDGVLEEEGDDAVVPDELSPAQIRVMLARTACDPSPTYVDDGSGVKYPTSVVQLRRLAGGALAKNESSLAVSVIPLFPRAHESASRLGRSCLSLVFEVCSTIPERQLRGISALPIWKQERVEGGGRSDGDEASYGILPQQYVTQVGEHILALVQALEPFASDAYALGLANEVMSDVMEVAIQPWKEFVAAAGCSFTGDGKLQLDMLMSGGDLSKYFLDDSNENDCESFVAKKTEEEDDDGEEAKFCNQWLDVVGMAVTGRLLERMMRIPRLGRRGAEHLATDLNYIMNVFTALGVPSHPHPLLKYITHLVMMEDQMLRSRIQLHREDTSAALEIITRAELRIAHVRGISI